MAKKLQPREKIMNHLKVLMTAGKNIDNSDKNLPVKAATYDKGPWTGLKLICLKYYIKPYLDIMSANKMRVAYIDLFSGPGLNFLGDKRIPFPGSALIPLSIRESKSNFSTYIFCDKNPDYLKALRERSNLLKKDDEKIIIPNHPTDANEFVFEIPKILKENKMDHSLVFIDPEGLELDLESLEHLIKSINCDIIINFPSQGIARVGTYKKTLERFLGVNEKSVPLSGLSQWAIKVYRKRLSDFGKDISTEIAIRAGGSSSYYYHLIPAVTPTTGGTPWFKVFSSMKELAEKFTGEVLDTITDQIEGRAKAVSDFK